MVHRNFGRREKCDANHGDSNRNNAQKRRGFTCFLAATADNIRLFASEKMSRLRATVKNGCGHLNHWLLLMAVATVIVGGCQAGAREDSASHGRELFATCAECHGPQGEGNSAIGAPNIAGMNAWYIET